MCAQMRRQTGTNLPVRQLADGQVAVLVLLLLLLL